MKNKIICKKCNVTLCDVQECLNGSILVLKVKCSKCGSVIVRVKNK